MECEPWMRYAARRVGWAGSPCAIILGGVTKFIHVVQ